MSDNTPESNQDSGSATSSETKSFSEKYSDVMGKVNELSRGLGDVYKRQSLTFPITSEYLSEKLLVSELVAEPES